MKSIKALILVITLLTLSSLFTTQSVVAQDSTILSPDFTVTGTLSSTHLSDYYRVMISSAGVYTIELNSTGSLVLSATVNRFSYGYPGAIEGCLSNTSTCFTIIPSSQYFGSFYQLEVSIEEISESGSSEYTVSINRVEPITVEQGHEYNLQQSNRRDSYFILDASGPNRTFRLEVNSAYSSHFIIYNSNGIRVYYRYFSSSSTIDEIILLDPGIYHMFIDTGSYSTNAITFQITPEDIPILEPGSSMQVYLDDPEGTAVLLPLIEGTQYSIELAPHSAQDVWFYIYLADYGIRVDDRGANFLESAADFVYWDNYVAFTGWELNPDMLYTQSDPRRYTAYSSNAIPSSGLLLRAFSDIGGSATLHLTKVQDVQLISTDVPITAQFDGIDGPFWKLYKFDNLLSGELYKFHLTHNPTDDYTLSPTYAIYTPEITDQNYLTRTRPLLSEVERTYCDGLPGGYTILDYENAIPTANTYYYSSQLCETWLYVSIPDGYYYGGYHYPIHSGSTEFEVQTVAPIMQNVNSEFLVDPSVDTSIYSVQLEGDCIYEITVTGTNYQSDGSISLWNQTGHMLPSLSYGHSAQTDKNTRHYQIEVECAGLHNLLVFTDGSSPVAIMITKKTLSVGVQYVFFIGGLAVAAVEGMIIGIVIGKVKFGKGNAG